MICEASSKGQLDERGGQVLEARGDSVQVLRTRGGSAESCKGGEDAAQVLGAREDTVQVPETGEDLAESCKRRKRTQHES